MNKEIIYPFTSDNFMAAWELWKAYKKEQFRFTYKFIGEQATLKSLSEDSGHDEEIAIKMINMAIANGWRGIFPIKTILINKPKSIFEQISQQYEK